MNTKIIGVAAATLLTAASAQARQEVLQGITFNVDTVAHYYIGPGVTHTQMLWTRADGTSRHFRSYSIDIDRTAPGADKVRPKVEIGNDQVRIAERVTDIANRTTTDDAAAPSSAQTVRKAKSVTPAIGARNTAPEIGFPRNSKSFLRPFKRRRTQYAPPQIIGLHNSKLARLGADGKQVGERLRPLGHVAQQRRRVIDRGEPEAVLADPLTVLPRDAIILMDEPHGGDAPEADEHTRLQEAQLPV